MEQWNIIQPEQLERSPFQMIGKDWMLITAEKEGKVNTMTASWGGMGVLWRRNVVFVFVRHSRHTYGFLEAADGFSCTFYPEQYRQALSYCGTVSGRDEDKIAHCGFTVDHAHGVPFFQQANTVIICKKIYSQQIEAKDFIDSQILSQCYEGNAGDLHRMYVGEIVEIRSKN
ncbi:flavin reductase family protein [Angelakisella massiliensis]|uniref:flavin reductase family protein n=1 Tax=Angelakisella massiliensis TaxID=1871018 RepID=UPI0008F9276D|nr:flavin reductase [Angelakisella massiliensis]